MYELKQLFPLLAVPKLPQVETPNRILHCYRCSLEEASAVAEDNATQQGTNLATLNGSLFGTVMVTCIGTLCGTLLATVFANPCDLVIALALNPKP